MPVKANLDRLSAKPEHTRSDACNVYFLIKLLGRPEALKFYGGGEGSGHAFVYILRDRPTQESPSPATFRDCAYAHVSRLSDL